MKKKKNPSTNTNKKIHIEATSLELGIVLQG